MIIDPTQQARDRLEHITSTEAVRKIRRAAIDRFAQLGFPNTRSEEWRYTNSAAIAKIASASPQSFKLDAIQLEHLLGVLPPSRMVFAGGKLIPELTTVKSSGLALEVNGVSFLFGKAERLEAHLDDAAARADHGFAALNLALFEDGAWIKVQAGAEVAEPVHLIFVSGTEGAVHARNLIHVGARSKLTLVEHHVGIGGQSLTNVVNDVILDDEAELSLVRLQDAMPDAFELGRSEIRLGNKSRFNFTGVQLGAKVGRNEVIVKMGPRSECSLGALYFADEDRVADELTLIEHSSDHGKSTQLVKGILGGEASGAYNGKVRVHAGTKENDARQSSKSLLLSENATANTRPQLEIYSEDVKCSHGATVGRLDEQQIFYLRSRGIGEPEARALLTYAFAQEVIDLAPENTRTVLEAAVGRRLGRRK